MWRVLDGPAVLLVRPDDHPSCSWAAGSATGVRAESHHLGWTSSGPTPRAGRRPSRHWTPRSARSGTGACCGTRTMRSCSRPRAGPCTRLWERRPVDDDFLVLSVGTGRCLRHTVVGPVPDAGSHHPRAPPGACCRPAPGCRRPGRGRTPQETVGVARALVAQACGWHSPRRTSHSRCCARRRARARLGVGRVPAPHPPAGRRRVPQPRGGPGARRRDQVSRRVAELTALSRGGPSRRAWVRPSRAPLRRRARRAQRPAGCSGCVPAAPGRPGGRGRTSSAWTPTGTAPGRGGCGGAAPSRDTPPGSPRRRGRRPRSGIVTPDAVSDRWAHRFAPRAGTPA